MSDGAYAFFSGARVARAGSLVQESQGHFAEWRLRMADDRSLRGGQDRLRVNMDQEYEARYWSNKFGVSQDDLRAAIAKVGPMASDLERHFGSNSPRKSA